MPTAISWTLIALASVLTLGACASAPGSARVAVLVEVDRPAGVTDGQLVAGFAAAAPTYQATPGLDRKYFVLTGTSVGGVYLWTDRQAADAFYSAEWQARIRKTYGSDAVLTWFEVPVVTKGGSLGTAGKDAVVAIVKVPAPWYAPAGMIRSRMKKAIPLYTDVSGLDFKYFSMADGRKVGGIYLWTDQAAADVFYDESWHARIRETYGTDADLTFRAAPVTVINRPVGD